MHQWRFYWSLNMFFNQINNDIIWAKQGHVAYAK